MRAFVTFEFNIIINESLSLKWLLPSNKWLAIPSYFQACALAVAYFKELHAY